MAARKTLTKAQGEKALAIVAEWMGPKVGAGRGCGECADCTHGLEIACERWVGTAAPTGSAAADSGLGPHLNPEWDWPGQPTPTILLEGGPYDWAIRVADERSSEFAAIGVFAEPYAAYALCLYRED